MACDPTTLLADAKCLLMLSPSQLLATWALQACSWSPVVEGGRITEEGDDRDTEEGDDRIIE